MVKKVEKILKELKKEHRKKKKKVNKYEEYFKGSFVLKESYPEEYDFENYLLKQYQVFSL